MKAVISNSLLKQIQPKKQPVEIRDEQLKGLLLRIQPTGMMTYYVEYGRGKRLKIGRHPAMTPQMARDTAKQVLGKTYQGEDPAQSKRDAKAHNLEAYLDEVYLPWEETHQKRPKEAIARIKSTFPDFLSKKLHEITPWLIEKWKVQQSRRGIKPATINRYLTDLRASLSRAVEWGLLSEQPLKGVRLLKVDANPVPRFLTEEEEKQLREALDAREEEARLQRDRYNQWRTARHFKPFTDLQKLTFTDHLEPLVLLSLNTGLRQGELFNLKWADVDFQNANLTVQGSGAKSGKTRHIPLNSEAFTVLQQWKAQSNGHVSDNDWAFPGKDGNRLDNVKKGWQSVLKKAKITGFRWHDMRHTFASNLVMAGVDLNTVRELLGHSDYTMTLRYAHLAPKHKADAVAKLVRGEAHG